jgi:hypothetical protein
VHALLDPEVVVHDVKILIEINIVKLKEQLEKALLRVADAL